MTKCEISNTLDIPLTTLYDWEKKAIQRINFIDTFQIPVKVF